VGIKGENMSFTPEMLAGIFGALVSGAFKVIPPLDHWFYNKLDKNYRGLVMLGISFLVPFIVLGLACVNLTDVVACSTTSIPELLKVWGAFVVANLGVFMMTPESNESRITKQAKFDEAVTLAIQENKG
jgi:hypothetical protein